MRNYNRRIMKDRRQKPSPMLSRYTFWGRRKGFRRTSDQQAGGYVDRYGPNLFLALTLILVFNVLDAWFTIVILHHGGEEVNPIVQAVIETYGDGFWLWKFGMVSFNLMILCLHSKYKPVNFLIILITLIYMGVIAYQIMLLKAHLALDIPW